MNLKVREWTTMRAVKPYYISGFKNKLVRILVNCGRVLFSQLTWKFNSSEKGEAVSGAFPMALATLGFTQEGSRQMILKDKDLKISNWPLETRRKFLGKMSENITKRVLFAVLDNLPEEARPEFDLIDESGNSEKMQEFLKAKISNVEELIQKAIEFTIDEVKTMPGIK